MVAARGGDPVIVHMLLEGGANIDVRDRKGKTAQAIAKKGGHDVVYEFIADEVDRRGKDRRLVAKAQTMLNKLGYRLGSADGVAGPKTVRAVRRFQKSHRIRVDGKITPALITALQRKMARRGTGRTLVKRKTSGTRSTAKLVAPRTAAEGTKDERAQSGEKSWLDRTRSSVTSFLKSNGKIQSSHAELCESSQDRWVQDAAGAWVECRNIPQF